MRAFILASVILNLIGCGIKMNNLSDKRYPRTVTFSMKDDVIIFFIGAGSAAWGLLVLLK